jgi:hypothetical protein
MRGILRPVAGTPKRAAEIVVERVLADGEVHVRYRVEDLGYTRTAALSSLEAATLRYAMHRSGLATLSAEERSAVEGALARLSACLDGSVTALDLLSAQTEAPAPPAEDSP